MKRLFANTAIVLANCRLICPLLLVALFPRTIKTE